MSCTRAVWKINSISPKACLWQAVEQRQYFLGVAFFRRVLYRDGCPFQDLSNHTTFRRFWAGETIPLIKYNGQIKYDINIHHQGTKINIFKCPCSWPPPFCLSPWSLPLKDVVLNYFPLWWRSRITTILTKSVSWTIP